MKVSENDLSQHVVNYARMRGYLVHRVPTWRPTGADPGFTDLVICGKGLLLFVELKADKGELTEAQRRWRDELFLAGAKWDIWRPSDWAEGRVDMGLA